MRSVELGFLFAAFLLLGAAALTYRNIADLAESEQRVARTHETIDTLEGTLSALKDAETGYRGYHLTGEDAYLEPYTKGRITVHVRTGELEALITDDPAQVQRLAVLEASAERVLEGLAHAVDLRRTEGFDPALSLLLTGAQKAAMDETREVVAAMQDAEHRLLEERAQRSQRSRAIATGTTLASTGLGLGLVAVGYALVGRDRRARERETAVIRESNLTLELRVAERTASLHREQQFQRALLEHVTDGIVACDASGQLTLLNRATREQYGLPEQGDLYLADGQTPMGPEEVPWLRALRGEQVRDEEMIVAPKSRPRRVLLASGQAFSDGGGELLGAVVSMRDVTEQRCAEQERQGFVRKLEESNRELEQFATIASHDLQEPLRKIQAFSDRLQEEAGPLLDERGRDYVTRIVGATGRMRTLIDDLLAFSRVTRRGQPFAVVSLDEVAAGVVSDLEERLKEVGGQIELGALPAIEADATQMRQLLQNLMGNALKFRHPDRAPVVHVSGQSTQDAHELIVTDNGIGFEPQYAERIFQMFQRLHGRGQYDGNGIGLAICRKIVERHDGTIKATATPGQGATFVVTLPHHPTRAQ